jgi:2'-5' RNA ligase
MSMITDTNGDAHLKELARVAEAAAAEDRPAGGNHLAIKRYKFVDPDKEFDEMVHTVSTRFVEVDAKMMEQRGRGYEQVHYRSLKEMMAAKPIRRRVLNVLSGSQLREINERLGDYVSGQKDLREARAKGKAEFERLKESGRLSEASSSFYLGLYGDEEQLYGTGQSKTVFSLQDTILPGTSSPQSKQQLFIDYLDMHRKSWEAATRNPVGKRIVDIIPQFVLGRGVIGSTKHQEGQNAWDDFWKRNKMRARSRLILKELLIYGEVFLRYFKQRDGLVVRSLDPSTIWDIVTNPDDIEDVKYYHQQYSILNTSPVPWASTTLFPGTLIIRQIPAKDIDHFKINSTSSEKRGRSQLYAILGWLLRFKEFANDRVLLNKMRAMFALDVAVKGDATDVATAEAQFSTPPGPGAVMVHNEAVTVEYKNANNNANEAKTDAEMILKIIAVGAGVSQQFLGVTDSATRAGALIQTEPDVKNFEMYQEVVEDMLMDTWERVKASKGVRQSTVMEFTFPALAQEDRSAKLKDIAFAEAMDYFSKERSGTMAAREFNITTYNFETEQTKIRAERGKDPVMALGMQQMPKVTADPAAMGEQPGLGGDLAPGSEPEALAGSPEQPLPKGFTPDKGPVTQTSGQMGFSAKRLSGRDLANTKATLNRPGFERGKEKRKIKTNQSEGTPLRATMPPEPYGIRLRETGNGHDYSSTQINLPPNVATEVKALAAVIPDDVLAEDGREDRPHVTVKYGLHGNDPSTIKPVLAKQPPVAFVLGKTKVFEKDDCDVVYVEVKSPGLGKLHKAVSEALPNTETYPTYVPHVTVAYVKKGEGQKYAGNATLVGTKVVASEVLFSPKDGTKINLPLGKPRHVWTKEARAKALEVRRQNALKRRQ